MAEVADEGMKSVVLGPVETACFERATEHLIYLEPAVWFVNSIKVVLPLFALEAATGSLRPSLQTCFNGCSVATVNSRYSKWGLSTK